MYVVKSEFILYHNTICLKFKLSFINIYSNTLHTHITACVYVLLDGYIVNHLIERCGSETFTPSH
jgi:hypothetical protein